MGDQYNSARYKRVLHKVSDDNTKTLRKCRTFTINEYRVCLIIVCDYEYGDKLGRCKDEYHIDSLTQTIQY